MITNYIFNLLKAETYTESDQGVTASILICRTTVSRAEDRSSIYRNYNHTGCMRRTLLTKTMLDNPHHCPSVSWPATCFTPTDDPTESACVCWINQHGRNQSSFSFFRFLNSFFTLVFYFVAFFIQVNDYVIREIYRIANCPLCDLTVWRLTSIFADRFYLDCWCQSDYLK